MVSPRSLVAFLEDAALLVNCFAVSAFVFDDCDAHLRSMFWLAFVLVCCGSSCEERGRIRVENGVELRRSEGNSQ